MPATQMAAPTATLDYGQPRRDEIPDTMPIGRVCADSECTTILSRYNPHEVCWLCWPLYRLLDDEE